MADVAAVASTTVMIINIVLAVVILGGIIFLFMYLWRFRKIRVKLYQETDTGAQLMVETKAREFKNRDGVTKWKLRWKGREIVAPPKNGVVLDNKGRKVCYGIIIDDNIVWMSHELSVNEETLSHINFKPLKSEHKTEMVHQIREANSYKRKRMMDVLVGLAPLFVLVIIIVVFLIFVPRTVEEVSQLVGGVADRINTLTDNQNKLLERYDALLNDKQLVQTQTTTDPPN